MRDADDWFRLFVQSVRDEAIFLLEADGVIRTWNTGAERITGFTAPEVVGKPFSFLHAEGEWAADAAAAILKPGAAEGRVEQEGWLQRKDGSRFWARVVTTALVADGGDLLGFANVMQDLADRRATPQTLV